jgi:hypothetical protein
MTSSAAPPISSAKRPFSDFIHTPNASTHALR